MAIPLIATNGPETKSPARWPGLLGKGLGTPIVTILRLLVVAGEKCEKLMGRLLVNIPVKDLQCDEIWSLCFKKEGHKSPPEKDDDSKGDVHCYVAIERNHKLVINFTLGRRNQQTTDTFIEGVRHANQTR